MSAALGVDLGATWLRVCLSYDGAVRTARFPAIDWRQLPNALPGILKKIRAPRLDALTVGSTRLGGKEGRVKLAKALKKTARRVRVLPDYEIAHLAAFGDGPGVILVASTGSAAFARETKGRQNRAGGYGPLLGDEGSGFWLGREGARDEKLRRALRLPHPLDLAHDADPVRATAALAPRVLNGSPRLRAEAARHLAALARGAANGLRLPRPTPLALHGSLFRNARLKATVLRELGRGWRVAEPRVSAERAAAGL